MQITVTDTLGDAGTLVIDTAHQNFVEAVVAWYPLTDTADTIEQQAVLPVIAQLWSAIRRNRSDLITARLNYLGIAIEIIY